MNRGTGYHQILDPQYTKSGLDAASVTDCDAGRIRVTNLRIRPYMPSDCQLGQTSELLVSMMERSVTRAWPAAHIVIVISYKELA